MTIAEASTRPTTGITQTLTLGKAINEGLRRAMENDDRVMLMGEDIGTLGGVYRITEGLQASFGERRVMDTPLAESAILGTAIGLAYAGYRPVCEIQFDGFIYPAFDQIVSQVARMHSRTRGAVRMPLTIRVPFGGGIGAAEHHSDSPEAYFTHTSGLRVVSISNPQDAFTVIQEAIASDDPVLFFEPKRRYHLKGEVRMDDAAAERVSMGSAAVVVDGTDVTLVAYGGLVHTAIAAAQAARSEGISVEVVDLRSLSPIDFATVSESVTKTGRLVITHEAAETGGLGAEIAAGITERCFYSLEHAPVRVTGFDIPYPASRLEKHHLPDLDRVLDGIDRAMDRPNSLTGTRNFS
ncbi:MAG: alpha-ketoacid dehydrogenase subunit beta [Salinibacterium sp.]|nr:alpha-ketoacid dehydrogenase subunit beta [Salinibacterium sp.]